MRSNKIIKHVTVMGSCDELHTGMQNLKAVKFSKFVHMSGIDHKKNTHIKSKHSESVFSGL